MLVSERGYKVVAEIQIHLRTTRERQPAHYHANAEVSHAGSRQSMKESRGSEESAGLRTYVTKDEAVMSRMNGIAKSANVMEL